MHTIRLHDQKNVSLAAQSGAVRMRLFCFLPNKARSFSEGSGLARLLLPAKHGLKGGQSLHLLLFLLP